MIVSGGHILAIDGINTGVSVLGDGLRTPLEVNPEILEYYSAGPGIALHQGDEATEIENTDHIFYEVCSGTIDGTTMTVSAGHDRYCKLDVPSSITDLRIVVADTDDPTTVSKTMFEFTLPTDTKLSDVYVENTSGGECPLMGPMYWSGDVTYQGIVTNKIATIFGYSPNEELGPVISVDDRVPLDAGNGEHIVYNKSGIIGDGKRIYELDELDNLHTGTYVAVDEDDADSAQKFDIGKMKSDIDSALQENEQSIVDLNDYLIDVSGELSDLIDSESDAIDALGLEVDNLENTVSGHTTSISELQEDVEGIQSDISDLQEKDTQIERDIGNLSDSIEDLDGRLTNDEDDIAAIQEVIPQDATSANKLVSETRLAQAIADFGGFEVVSLDPNTRKPDVQTPSEKIIYLTKDSQSTATDPYTEWIYRESEWEIIGETTVDLSNYYTKTETDDLLDDKVDKETGKGLSTNDFTDAYQTKLDDIETSAQKNVQSDWEEADSASDSYIKNKPDPINLQAGEKISITESGSSLIISSQSAPQVNADWNSTSGVSEILNKPDLSVYAEIDNLASVAFTGDYEDLTNTPSEKTFSAGPNITITSADDTITIGATVPEQVQSDWEETDASALSYIKNKPTPLSLIPGTGISVTETQEGLEIAVSASYAETSAVNEALDDIEDEIDYVSGAVDQINTDLEDYVTETEMEAAIADFGGFKKVPVDQSGEPDVSDPSTKIIYLTHIDSATGPDLYREWLWDSAGPSWEMLGDTSISLQGYATEVYVDSHTSGKMDKSMSAEFYPMNENPSGYLVENDLNGYATEEYVQQETSGKVDAVEGYGLSQNDFTDELLDKLNDIASSAEVNVQSDWNETNSASDAFIKNKPTIPEAQVQSDWEESDSAEPSYIKNKPQNLSIVGGEGITVTESQGNLEISVSADYATEDYVDLGLDDKLDKTYSAEFYPMNENPSGYLTEHQSLSAYATSAWVEQQRYLTSEDLTGYATENYVQQETSGKVDKVDGKGLSTNDFTDELLDKLNDIEASAQKNVQSDWEESDTTSDSYIQNKPTPISMKGGEGISVTESQGDLVIAVSADYATEDYVDTQVSAKMDKSMSAEFYPYHSNPSGYLVSADLGGYATQTWVGEQGYLTEVPEGYATEDYVQTQTSGKADKVSNATQGHLAALSSDGNLLDSTYSPASFATSAQGAKADTAVQDPSYVHTDNNYTTTEKNLLASLDSSVSAIEEKIPSNATSQNKLVTKSDLDAAATGAFEVVPLGSNDQPDVAYPNGKTIYLTKDSSLQVTDPYTEWIWLSGTSTFEVIGETTIDLTDYATQNYVLAQTSGKVDKVTGMGLSHVDFTSAYQSKLDSISPSAEVNVQSDWSVTNSALDSYIANKPDIIVPLASTSFSAPKKLVVVTSMPAAANIDPDTIYLVKESVS